MGYIFFELFAFIILISTLVLGINYFVIITRPLHPIPVRKRSSSSCYMIETYNAHHRFSYMKREFSTIHLIDPWFLCILILTSAITSFSLLGLVADERVVYDDKKLLDTMCHLIDINWVESKPWLAQFLIIEDFN